MSSENTVTGPETSHHMTIDAFGNPISVPYN